MDLRKLDDNTANLLPESEAELEGKGMNFFAFLSRAATPYIPTWA